VLHEQADIASHFPQTAGQDGAAKVWDAVSGAELLTLKESDAQVWSVVFFATAATSLFLIKRDADRRGEPFLSNGSRSAFRAMLPAMLVAGVLTLVSFARDTVPQQVPWWMALYGVALLGMWHFAPKSIVVLGWAFTLAGAAALCGLPQAIVAGILPSPSNLPSFLMAGTFGLFHLIYAACTWPRRA